MTREQILALPAGRELDAAGRELDALVSEHVMGDILMAYPCSRGTPTRWYNSSRGAFGLQYSLDTFAAFLVVEAMREKYRRVEIHLLGRKHEDGMTCCCQIEDGLDEVDCSYIASVDDVSVPLAICKAALLTLAEPVNINAVCESVAQPTATPAPVPQRAAAGEGWGSL